jgi:hypothetical protein
VRSAAARNPLPGLIIGGRSTLARRVGATVRRGELLLGLPPAVLLLAWLGLLIASFGAIVEVIYANADISSAPVIGELYPKAPSGASTVLGYHPWYSTLWFEWATRWLPFHRQVWEVGPWLVAVAGVVLVAWSTAKVAGRWCGWLVGLVLVCASPRLLSVQFGSDLHGATAVNVCILDAYLVLLVLRGGRIGGRVTHLVLCVLVTLVTAAGLASDALLVPAGLLPFVVAGLTQLRWTPGAAGRRTAVTTLLVAAGTVVGAEIAIGAMHRVHVYTGPHTVAFARFDHLVQNALSFGQSLTDLFNGDFGGAAIGARSVLAFACAAVIVVAFVVAVRLGLRQVDRFRSAPRPTAPAREAHVSFWFLALILMSVSFVLSNLAAVYLGRYLLACGYGIVVLGAVSLAGRSYARRLAGLAAACVLAGTSVVSLAASDIPSNPYHFPRHDLARFLSTFAQGEGLRYGYAGYWVAAPLTWESNFQVEVFPVATCSAPSGLCTYPWHEISSWYTPRANTRTFLVVDPRYGPPVSDFHLGDPAEVVSFGEYKIYVYGFDIASKLGAAKAYGVNGA